MVIYSKSLLKKTVQGVSGNIGGYFVNKMKKKRNNNLADLKAQKRAAISLDTGQENVDENLKKMNLLALLLNVSSHFRPSCVR